MARVPEFEQDFRAGRHFRLGSLDFGTQITAAVRAALTNIAGVMQQLRMQDFGVVKSWFAIMAFVSKTSYPAWSPQSKGVLTRGLTVVWDDLQHLDHLDHSLQHAQDIAVQSLVRPLATQHKDKGTSKRSITEPVPGVFNESQWISQHSCGSTSSLRNMQSIKINMMSH